MSGIAFEDQFLGFLDGAIRQQKRMADRAMVQFIVLRLLMVAASASLPALTTIENRVWSTVAAVLVAVLTGLDTQFRWGEEWRHWAKSVEAAKEFIKYMLEPKVLNQYLKGGLGRFAIPMREMAKSDPFWLKEDPHRTVHTEQTLFGPTLPIYEVYNPAIAEVDAEHVFSVAEFDVLKNGMAPEAAIDKAFKRADEIFTKYPIAQS
jgi:hypothetical protein